MRSVENIARETKILSALDKKKSVVGRIPFM